jgi:hypothetical protein
MCDVLRGMKQTIVEGFAVKFERPVDRDYLEHLIIKT